MIFAPIQPPTSDTMVFQFILGDVLDQLRDKATEIASAMSTIVGGAAVPLYSMYTIFILIGIMQGTIDAPLTEWYRKTMKAYIILMFATTIGLYNEWIADFFWLVPGKIGQEVALPGSSANYGIPSHATAALLDRSLAKGLEAGKMAWDQMSLWDGSGAIGYALIAFAIWVFVALICGYAGALIVTESVGLTVMLGLGPLFIPMALFDTTNQLFTSWTRQLLTFVAMFLILAGVITITFDFFEPFMKALATDYRPDVIILSFAKTLVLCCISVFVLYNVQGWAAGLAGGVSLYSSGAIGRAVSGGIRPLMHSHYNPNKKNADGTMGGHQLRGAIPSAVNRVRQAYRENSNAVNKN